MSLATAQRRIETMRYASDPLAILRARTRVVGECWEWHGAANCDGYGVINLRGLQHRVHRLSWEVHHGAIPDEMCVCHHCDNRRCWRPGHLFLGSPMDNTRDRYEKGRHLRGAAHPHAKITEDDARLIVLQRRGGATTGAVSKMYGLSGSSVRDIVAGRTWGHATQNDTRAKVGLVGGKVAV